MNLISLFEEGSTTHRLSAIILIALFLASSLGAVHWDQHTTAGSSTAKPLDFGPAVQVSCYRPFYSEYGVKQFKMTNSTVPSNIRIMIGLQESNTSSMDALLQQISSPSSLYYHHYLTQSQFDSQFGGSEQVYGNLIAYLKNKGITSITSYSDRLSLSFSATPSQVKSIFNVTLSDYLSPEGQFYATTSIPELPEAIASHVTAIAGLTDYSKNVLSLAPLGITRTTAYSAYMNAEDGSYPQPINRSGIQYLYGSDMQVAYQETPLFKQYGYPTNMVAATILWSGTYTGVAVNTKYGILEPNTPVGPFYAPDIYAYLNQTLPAGQPHSKIYGVPVDGAPAPGLLASYDSTGANLENTLDLEMLASLAPGSSIFNFYAKSPTQAELDTAFNTILNPQSDTSLTASEISSINNVSVISNSWGGNDTYDSVWVADLAQAQLRGITILAASGDGGDSPYSSENTGTLATFPASAAYDTFGTVAVGGVTTTLNTNLTIRSQENWYVNNTTFPSTPYGTQSGISTVYAEPVWQNQSEANATIKGAGRGVPDLSAVANNTILTITIDGSTYNSTNLPYGVTFAAVAGTSISCPMIAGLFLEINHALGSLDQGYLGFPDPAIYKLGSEQYTEPVGNSTISVVTTSGYNSSLPVLPFYPVTEGQNYYYHAKYGYSLLNGWGTLNAYPFMSSILNLTYAGRSGYLSGVYYNVSLTSINASLQNNSGQNVGGTNFTISLSAAIADSTGQPVYLVSESVSFLRISPGGFYENVTAFLRYPFLAQTQSMVTESGTYAQSTLQLPGSLNLSITINDSQSLLDRSVVLNGSGDSISMPAPLAGYVIGILNYSYYYGNSVYFNGPIPNNPVSGGLDPQLTIGSGNASFTSVSNGSVSGIVRAGIRTSGLTKWKAPGTVLVESDNMLRPTQAENFGYTRISSSSWNLDFSKGSNYLGIAAFENGNYLVSFTETGLPSGTGWYVNVNGLIPSYQLINSNYSVILTNGSYQYSASSVNTSYAPTDNSTFTVNGSNITVDVHFTVILYNVTFVETGLGDNATWSLTLAGYNSTGQLTQSSYSYMLPNGTYHYVLSRSSDIYTISNFSGEIVVAGSARSVNLIFYKVTYTVTLRETGLPDGHTWNITFNGVRYSLHSSSLILVLTNGSYQYSVEPVSGFRTANPSGVVAVNGSLQDLVVEFSMEGIHIPGVLIDLGIAAAIVAAVGYVVYRVRRK